MLGMIGGLALVIIFNVVLFKDENIAWKSVDWDYIHGYK